MIRSFIGLAAALLLNACALTPQQALLDTDQLAQMRRQPLLESWVLQGRLAVVDEKESFSASINWRHQAAADVIELSGPLAQGKVLITVSPDSVSIDDGDSPRRYQGDVNLIISEQLGVNIPVTALKYWVLGVNDPQQPYIELADGFMQNGWLIKFAELQPVGGELLPKKITALNQKTRVKLIVDQWSLS